MIQQPRVLKASIGTILQAVEDRLVKVGIVPSANEVKWVAGPPQAVPKLDANLDVLLHLQGFTAGPQSWYDGAGRQGFKVARRLDVVPRTRLHLDAPDRVKAWLLGAATDTGYLPTEEAILNALLEPWSPQDAAGNELCVCPLHVLSGVSPFKDKASAGWGWGGVAFEIQHSPPLTIPGPP